MERTITDGGLRTARWTRCEGDAVNRNQQSAVRNRLSAHLKDHLSRLSPLDRPDRLVEAREREAVRDHRRRVELAGAEKPRHLVPGVVHASADDAVDRDALEDHFGREVHLHWLGRDAE